MMRNAKAFLEQLSRIAARLLEDQAPPPHPKKLRLFDTQEAAKFLGVEADKVRRMSRRGELPPPEQIDGSRHGWELTDILKAKRQRDSRRRGHDDDRYATVVVVANDATTCGKTTLTAHIAQFCAIEGLKVLCVDADPQAGLSRLLGYWVDATWPPLEGERYGVDPNRENTLAAIFANADTRGDSRLAELVRSTHWVGIDLVPAGASLGATAMEIVLRQRSEPGWDPWGHLSRCLDDIRSQYDLVLIDTSAYSVALRLPAIYAADGLIIPLQAQDRVATGSFVKTLERVIRELAEHGIAPPSLMFIRCVLTRCREDDPDLPEHAKKIRRDFEGMLLEAPFYHAPVLMGVDYETIYELDAAAPNRQAVRDSRKMSNRVNIEILSLIQQCGAGGLR